MGKYISVFTTTGSKEEAEKIAKKLLKDKLAACVQICPVSSIYRWKGKIEKAREYLCIIKSKKVLYIKIEKTIKALHPYKVPEIIFCDVTSGSKDYLAWLEEETE
ncbi:MAG: divalent-cation tolerance protein CutA [Candidatus Omnitrophica bacterium]|nr:divalent-cation tolerance protein CutA [Candidatus Omnitrophota bacterium]MCM8777826.1 divalent-cation tolerance protein CutA [Candidatus Omnitrophota bacterium]